jgi:hypothetical protein
MVHPDAYHLNMDGLLGHNFKIALPFVVAFIAVPAILLAAQSLWQIATLNTVPGTAGAIIGDGVDSFAYLAAPLTGTLLQAIIDNGGILTIIALVATAMSVVEAVRRLFIALRGPGDAAGLVAYGASRGRRIISANLIHAWGTVRDSVTGDALALARISLMDSAGRPLASTVADLCGQYGFASTADEIPVGCSLSVRKSGYYGVMDHRPVLSSAGRHGLDVPLHPMRSRARRNHALWRVPAHLAFIGGALTVPLVAMGSGTAGVVLAVAFATSGAINVLTDPT